MTLTDLLIIAGMALLGTWIFSIIAFLVLLAVDMLDEMDRLD
jgi:hypothetical protein